MVLSILIKILMELPNHINLNLIMSLLNCMTIINYLMLLFLDSSLNLITLTTSINQLLIILYNTYYLYCLLKKVLNSILLDNLKSRNPPSPILMT
jgi:hypothetical protein